MIFKDRQRISMTFRAWKMKFLIPRLSNDLYEPCCNRQGVQFLSYMRLNWFLEALEITLGARVFFFFLSNS